VGKSEEIGGMRRGRRQSDERGKLGREEESKERIGRGEKHSYER
jgi:hypothetical protein